MAELAPVLADPLQSTGHGLPKHPAVIGHSSQHCMVPSLPETLLTYNLEAFQTCLRVSDLHIPATSRDNQAWYPLSRGNLCHMKAGT